MTRAFVPRKGAPKSRRGCLTCKVRRIKCDETRPICVRCESTGRKCDGYTDQSQSPISLDPSLTTLAINDVPGQRLQRRSLDFFRTCTLPNISFHFGPPVWTKLALQASQSEPALQHAAAALGALHEYLEAQKSSIYLLNISDNSSIDYATHQYAQALTRLRNLLTLSDNRSIELALIGALMCMYYEVLQQNFVTAQVHLEKCLNVLNSLVPSRSSWLTNTTDNKMQIDDDIIQAFVRLDIEASCTLGKRSPSLCITGIPLNISTPFTSITQARQLLYGLTSQLHSFMRSTADAYRSNLRPIPLQIIAESNFLQSSLKEWKLSFSAFLIHPTTKLTRQEQQAANILSIQQNVTHMKAATCLYAEEMIFDQFDREFEEILCLADYLIHISVDSVGGEGAKLVRKKVVLSFDMGIIEALFWTAIKCRKTLVRHRAIDVLKHVTWQEGVWNAEMMAAVAQRFVELEEEGIGGVDWRGGMSSEEVRTPEWLRLHDHGWEMNLKSRRIEIRAGRRENGADGEWTWLREVVVW